MKLPLELTAEAIMRETGFVMEKEIYRGTFYTAEHLRDIIYAGTYQGKSSVFKIYDDPRLTDEPCSLASFNAFNKSKILTAPQVYASHMVTPHAGWMIVEQLPEGGAFFSSPMSTSERAEFLHVYVDYRKNFPTTPTRELELAERVSTAEFAMLRMGKVFISAHEKEAIRAAQGESRILDEQFLRRYEKGAALLRDELRGRRMVWCHGHFKGHEVYKVSPQKYYLIDFAHTHLYPEGFEFGFMAWADQLMTLHEGSRYDDLKAGVYQWMEEFTPIAQQLGWERIEDLLRVSMIERILATILADIMLSDEVEVLKRKKIELLSQLCDELSSS